MCRPSVYATSAGPNSCTKCEMFFLVVFFRACLCVCECVRVFFLLFLIPRVCKLLDNDSDEAGTGFCSDAYAGLVSGVGWRENIEVVPRIVNGSICIRRCLVFHAKGTEPRSKF